MKKLLMALTALLLLAGAMLPGIASAVMDRHTEASYQPIHSVALDISRETPLTALEKLRLIQNVVDIDPSQATMTEAEVYAAAEAGMQPYIDAGLFQWFQPDHQSAVPKLAVDTADPSRHLVCWTVTYISKRAPNQTLLMDLDDETGQILGISHACYEEFSMDGVWERNQKTLDAFSAIFFSGLGLTEEAAGAEYRLLERDGGVSVAQYRFMDDLAVSPQIDFYAEGGGGFFTVFWF